jgi:hypothetical protein
MAIDHAVRRKEPLCLGRRLDRCICRSRLRVGRCEFSARLFNYRLVLAMRDAIAAQAIGHQAPWLVLQPRASPMRR